MSNKENCANNAQIMLMRPVHQGRAFMINLGHNNGPYLAKDIMYSNKKSICLLAAKQILQSQINMSNMMSALNKQQQNQSKIIRKSFKVQNWFSKCEFLCEEVTYIQQQSKKLRQEEERLKKEIKNCFNRLVQQNQQVSSSFKLLFKNLARSIRDQSNDQKNVSQERKRDIEELTNFRNKYLDQLVNCQRRIIKTQQFLGINSQSDNLQEL